jgi:choline monooxygenase
MAAERTATLPYRWYSDPEVLQAEQERIFARSWLYAGRVDEIAESGSYLAAQAGDVPLLVTRSDDGELRAFVNVCRHRGSVLTEGAGHRKSIQCRYHAWTYSLEGKLLKAPRSEREAGFTSEDLGLLAASVDTWGPFLFVNADPDAAPLADTLGELPDTLAEAFDLSRLRFHSRVHYTLDANWKIAVENFLECYHCPTAHPTFSDVVDVDPDAYVLEPHSTYASQFATVRERPRGLPYEPYGDVERGQYHLLWPNLKINVYLGRPNLSIGPVVPDGPDRTVGFLDYFFGDDVDDAWIGGLLALDDQVGREDTALVEGVHRGMRSRRLEHGRLLLESEQLIAAFQRWLLDHLD